MCVYQRMYSVRLLKFWPLPLLAVASWLAWPVHARGPLHVANYDPPRAFAPGAELRLSGVNRGQAAVTLVVRLDDVDSSNYANRASPERRLPPGPFVLRIPMTGLRTPLGRTLDSSALKQLVVFTVPEDDSVQLDLVRIEPPPKLPGKGIGWDLGPGDGLLYPGFRRLGPDDPAFGGAKIHAVRRPGSDALLTDGLVGIRHMALPLDNGRWRVALWIEDPGEWEAIPHPLRRHIRLNGRMVHDREQDARSWIKTRYLAGRDDEALLDGDPWELHGSRRGGLVESLVEVSDGRLVIELDGDGFRATHLAAVLVEPASSRAALDFVYADRRQRYLETWRTDPPSWPPVSKLGLRRVDFRPQLLPDTPEALPEETVVAARGANVILDFVAQSPRHDTNAKILLRPPTLGGLSLPATLRTGHWRLRRAGGASSLLVAEAGHLRGDVNRLRLDPRLPRRTVIQVTVPKASPTGVYTGALELHSGADTVTVPFHVEVLASDLPPAGRPIGIYLAEAPHLTWFKTLDSERAAQRICDLGLLQSLGLTSLAPPLAVPTAQAQDRFLADLERVRRAGFSDTLLDYASSKRLVGAKGMEAAAVALGAVHDNLASRGKGGPVWAIADEPGVGPDVLRHQARLAGVLRAASPDVRLAGQLNNPRQFDLLPLYDIALLNPGFGVDGNELERVRKTGAEPWFYNMTDYRLAAGFYLWRVDAGGYLQWHGRMPNADPYDPTDGREDDYQMLYPEPGSCAKPPDVDAGLLALSEGITDLRWLRWLERMAATDPRAATLVGELRKLVPPRWEEAVTAADPARLRQQITELARELL